MRIFNCYTHLFAIHMIRNLLILFFGMLLLLEACSSNKSINSHTEPFFVGWNEDTVNSYQITLLKNKNFYYAVVKKENNIKTIASFSGTYKFSSDSIILFYKTESKPHEFANYIIKEVSGDYLIQYFADNTKRIFLRRQKTGHYF